ncbi:MAG: hypothetical protein ACXW19_00420 [Thermoanaerobaculia bacterium]
MRRGPFHSGSSSCLRKIDLKSLVKKFAISAPLSCVVTIAVIDFLTTVFGSSFGSCMSSSRFAFLIASSCARSSGVDDPVFAASSIVAAAG